MIRRNFLKVGSGLVALVASSSLLAVDYRKTKPKAWFVKNDTNANGIDLKGTNAAIKSIFGTSKTISGNVKIKAPKVAENGAIIPINVSTKLKAKRIALFQSANSESLIAIFDVPKNGIPNYDVRIRMGKTATVTAVIETTDGKLYRGNADVTVTLGGCGG